MFAALVKVRKKDFCIVLTGKHQIKSRDRAPLRRDRPKQALFGAQSKHYLEPKASTIWSPKQALFGAQSKHYLEPKASTIWSRRGDYVETRGQFLESPENLSGPKSHS